MKENRKYELTNETINVDGYTLHRIKALRSFNDIKAGDLGGFIDSEENLSQEGVSWVYDDAKVFEDAMVLGDALVAGDSIIRNAAKVYGEASVIDSQVYDFAHVYGNASIAGCEVFDRAKVHGNCDIGGDFKISGTISIDNYKLSGSGFLNNGARVSDCGKVIVPDFSQTVNPPLTRDLLIFLIDTQVIGQLELGDRSVEVYSNGLRSIRVSYEINPELDEPSYFFTIDDGTCYVKTDCGYVVNPYDAIDEILKKWNECSLSNPNACEKDPKSSNSFSLHIANQVGEPETQLSMKHCSSVSEDDLK